MRTTGKQSAKVADVDGLLLPKNHDEGSGFYADAIARLDDVRSDWFSWKDKDTGEENSKAAICATITVLDDNYNDLREPSDHNWSAGNNVEPTDDGTTFVRIEGKKQGISIYAAASVFLTSLQDAGYDMNSLAESGLPSLSGIIVRLDDLLAPKMRESDAERKVTGVTEILELPGEAKPKKSAAKKAAGKKAAKPEPEEEEEEEVEEVEAEEVEEEGGEKDEIDLMAEEVIDEILNSSATFSCPEKKLLSKVTTYTEGNKKGRAIIKKIFSDGWLTSADRPFIYDPDDETLYLPADEE